MEANTIFTRQLALNLELHWSTNPIFVPILYESGVWYRGGVWIISGANGSD